MMKKQTNKQTKKQKNNKQQQTTTTTTKTLLGGTGQNKQTYFTYWIYRMQLSFCAEVTVTFGLVFFLLYVN